MSGAGPPDSPSNFHITCRSPHLVYLSWEEPLNNGAIITEYRIDWSQNSQEETDYEATFSLVSFNNYLSLITLNLTYIEFDLFSASCLYEFKLRSQKSGSRNSIFI